MEKELQDILSLIDKNWNEKKIDKDDLQKIRKHCKNIIKDEELNFYTALYEKIEIKEFINVFEMSAPTDPLKDKQEGDDMIKKFNNNATINNKYKTILTISNNVAKDISQNGDVNIYLAEDNDGIILCIKSRIGDFYKISGVDSINRRSNVNNSVSSYDQNLGNKLDTILGGKNTRRFTITENFFNDYFDFTNSVRDSKILLSPALMSDNKFTFVLNFSDANGNPDRNAATYDRNGLCPPPPTGQTGC